MDLLKAIRDLYEEKQQVEKVIAYLESLLAKDQGAAAVRLPRRRGRKSMGPAERLEVSWRMKEYWRRREKAVPPGPPSPRDAAPELRPTPAKR